MTYEEKTFRKPRSEDPLKNCLIWSKQDRVICSSGKEAGKGPDSRNAGRLGVVICWIQGVKGKREYAIEERSFDTPSLRDITMQ